MQTQLADFIRDTPEGREAESILRKCVHCGFCTATCPSYQVLGDDLDSPRGRIYLMKRALEGAPVSDKTRLHLDRCLTCRACETTCPSGVRYGRLVDIGRAYVEKHTRRSAWDRMQRAALSFGLPRTGCSRAALRVGQPLRAGMAPESIPPLAPGRRHVMREKDGRAARLRAAGARAVDQRRGGARARPHRHFAGRGAGRGLLRRAALPPQLPGEGRDDMRALIDAWWPLVAGARVEAIVATASGCGVTIKEYAHMLAIDGNYRGKAERISDMTRDLSEVIEPQQLARKAPGAAASPSSRLARCSTASRSAARSRRCSSASAMS